MGGLNETIMEAEPLLSLPMGPVRTLGDNRVGWIPNCEDAAPPRCAPVCKATCCAFCAFCAVRYSNFARASGGTCSACYAFCACYLVCTCCTRCARSTRFQNLTCNTVGHKSAPPARNVQMVAKGISQCRLPAKHQGSRARYRIFRRFASPPDATSPQASQCTPGVVVGPTLPLPLNASSCYSPVLGRRSSMLLESRHTGGGPPLTLRLLTGAPLRGHPM